MSVETDKLLKKPNHVISLARFAYVDISGTKFHTIYDHTSPSN